MIKYFLIDLKNFIKQICKDIKSMYNRREIL